MNLELKTTTYNGAVSILDSAQVRYIRGGATIDKAKVSDGYLTTVNGVQRRIVPLGSFMGKITATGKYCPCKITTLAANALSTDTTLTLTNAKPFQPGDVLDVNGTQVTIAAAGVNYTTNVITLTAAIGVAKTAGDVAKAKDGSETALFILYEEADVTENDQVVTGFDHARVITARLPIAPVAAIKTDLSGVAFV